MATTLTYADLLLRFPEFLAPVDAIARIAQINLWIQIAARQVRLDVLGDDLDDALLTLAAHFVALVDRNNEAHSGGVGAVTARTEGEHIISFSVLTRPDGYNALRTTSYGLIFLLAFLEPLDVTPVVTG